MSYLKTGNQKNVLGSRKTTTDKSEDKMTYFIKRNENNTSKAHLKDQSKLASFVSCFKEPE
jgi:hypothetical protein